MSVCACIVTVDVGEDLLHTARLMTTLVPVNTIGNLNFRNWRMLLSIVATAPWAEIRDLREGIVGFLNFIFDPLDPAARCFASKPGFSACAARNSGPSAAVSFAGRVLTRFCRNGGRLPYIFFNWPS